MIPWTISAELYARAEGPQRRSLYAIWIDFYAFSSRCKVSNSASCCFASFFTVFDSSLSSICSSSAQANMRLISQGVVIGENCMQYPSLKRVIQFSGQKSSSKSLLVAGR